jgi:hypothetical protein
VFAYTWQFGNGLSASLSAEDASAYGAPVFDLNAVADDRQGTQMPNIAGNLRVDQAWGSAQIMGALHNVGARYNATLPADATCATGGANTNLCGYPSNEWGWAVGAGMTL